MEVRRAHPALLRRRRAASYLAAGTPVGDARVLALRRASGSTPPQRRTGAAGAAVDVPRRSRARRRGSASARAPPRARPRSSSSSTLGERAATARRGPPRAPRPSRDSRSRRRAAGRAARRRPRAPAAPPRKRASIVVEVGRLAEDVRAEPRRAAARRAELEHRRRSRAPPRARRRAARATVCPPAGRPTRARRASGRSCADGCAARGRPRSGAGGSSRPPPPLEPAAVESLGESLHRGARVWRLDLDALADENLQPPGRAVECIAFRHPAKPTIEP